MAAKKRANLSARIEDDLAKKPVDLLFGKKPLESTEENKNPVMDETKANEEKEVKAEVKDDTISKQIEEPEKPKEKKKESPLNSVEMVVTPRFKEEARSKRVNFLVQPSVYKKAQKKCKTIGDSGISVNELINQFLINFVDE